MNSPYAQAADTAPPQLLDWTLQDTNVDISKGDGKATVKFILSDESGIELPNLLLKSLDTTQMTSFATVKEIIRSGKLISYEATVIVKFGQAPKNWQWVLYPLRDSLGNASTSFGPDSKWPSTVVVTDGVFMAKIQSDIAQC
jgi:serine protease